MTAAHCEYCYHKIKGQIWKCAELDEYSTWCSECQATPEVQDRTDPRSWYDEPFRQR